jgi:hypothetical protein
MLLLLNFCNKTINFSGELVLFFRKLFRIILNSSKKLSISIVRAVIPFLLYLIALHPETRTSPHTPREAHLKAYFQALL